MDAHPQCWLLMLSKVFLRLCAHTVLRPDLIGWRALRCRTCALSEPTVSVWWPSGLYPPSHCTLPRSVFRTSPNRSLPVLRCKFCSRQPIGWRNFRGEFNCFSSLIFECSTISSAFNSHGFYSSSSWILLPKKTIKIFRNEPQHSSSSFKKLHDHHRVLQRRSRSQSRTHGHGLFVLATYHKGK